jgi:RNA polymerase sigma-70 factor, ECF subfamily
LAAEADTTLIDENRCRQLLLRTAGRDPDALGDLYATASGLMLSVAMRVVGRREVAEEILHESFIRIWRHAQRFDPMSGNALAWMSTIVRNLAIDHAASAGQSRVMLAGDDLEAIIDGQYAWSEPADPLGTTHLPHLRACLDELEGPHRQALVLCYHHGMTHAELATSLQRPLGTVKSWVRRALSHLKSCLESEVSVGRKAP